MNGVTTNYIWVNSQITSQETNGQYTYFRYDANGQVMALNWQDEEYFYVTNIQGDIIGIADAQGNLVVEYAYDEWGTCTSVTGDMAGTLGADNPFRYRGYYFDAESGLYISRAGIMTRRWEDLSMRTRRKWHRWDRLLVMF